MRSATAEQSGAKRGVLSEDRIKRAKASPSGFFD